MLKKALNLFIKFVKNYISNNTPYNGLLIWHGVGVGKTCAAISQDTASALFKAEPHSDPKPEISGTGTFTQDGQVEPTGAETQPETPEVSNAESQPASTDATGV